MKKIFILLFIISFTYNCKAQNSINISNINKRDAFLYEFCKVWGFLKYYHPGITKEKLDWDDVLVSLLPKVKSALNKDEFNTVLNELINKAEKSNKVKEYKKNNIILQADLDWINDTTIISGEISKKLISIKNKFYPFNNFYYKSSLFKGNIKFKNEKGYNSLFPSQELRILSLFRYWNCINYFFPYKNLMDKNWDNVLIEYIPKFINCTDSISYLYTVLALTKSLNDGHATYCMTNSPLKQNEFSLPFSLRYVEGKTIIYKVFFDTIKTIKRGDIISNFNGIEINNYRNKYSSFIGASNDVGLQKYIDWAIPDGRKNDTIYIKINNDSNKLYFVRNISTDDLYSFYYNKSSNSRIINEKYLYIDFREITSVKKLKKITDSLKYAKGLIIDLRQGAGIIGRNLMRKISNNKKTYSINPLIPCKNMPGNFEINKKKLGYSVRGSKKSININTVILVNERTQSYLEFLAMKYQSLNNVKTIGSQTAGADGNISSIRLPGKISTCFSCIGIFYPDGTQTQRLGVKIDIIVKPTIKGIIDGKDEVLDSAIEYLNTLK